MNHGNDASDFATDIAIFSNLGPENDDLGRRAGSVDSALADDPTDRQGSIDTANHHVVDVPTEAAKWIGAEAEQQSVSGSLATASLAKLGLYAVLAVQAVLS